MMDHMSDDEHDLGLAHDLRRLAPAFADGGGPGYVSRRAALGLLGGVAAVTFTALTSPRAFAATKEIPEETAGPFPGDGSNGPNVLNTSGVVRSDIRSSFGTSNTRAGGIPLAVTLRVLDAASEAPLKGAAVYAWHCDREGRYSLYSPGVTDENYLRGVQVADAAGRVTFRSVYPGCYPGRWPHIHFEVYPSLRAASKGTQRLATSQLALPEAASRKVYATRGYDGSTSNLNQLSLATDMVFRDGWKQQLAAVTGTPGSGLRALLTVPV